MSLMSSQNESSLLYSQAKALFEKAKIAIDDGSIRTETQLVHEVFQAFNAFFESVGQPNLKVRYAPEGGPPWSEDYNDMMDEIKDDLEMLYGEVELIGQTLYTDFNHNTVQHDMLSTRYNDILDKMKDLELYSGVSHNAMEYANEDFLNSDKIDFSRSTLTSADISNGVASLPIKSKINVSPNSQVTIITGNTETDKYIIGSASNGIPGNNTEIHTVTDGILATQKYTPTFVGDQNSHSNYASVIDENANTWFEYERISIREHDKVNVAKNLGWQYQVNGSTKIEYVGAPNNNVLKLQMQITLPQETVINQIFLNMYTPPNYGAKTAKVKDILVTDGRIPPYSIFNETYKVEGYNFNFDPVNAKVVYILFEQSEKYATDIGHIYYEKTSASQRTGDYALGNEINSTKYAQRIDGPLVSLSSLGLDVELNSNKVSVKYPTLESDDYEVTPMSAIISDLTSNIEDKDTDIGIEKFEGWRWCIGIRDIEIYTCEYENEGEIVTKPFSFANPIDKISLNASEILPASILKRYETKYNYLKYYVSIDDGGTWNPITPMEHEIVSENQPPKVYTVRTLGTDSMKLTNKAAYLESETPVYNLRLKIVITKPDTVSTFATASNLISTSRLSPILDSYTVNVVTEKEVFDSEKSYKIVNATEVKTTNGGDTSNPSPIPDGKDRPGLNPRDEDCDKTDPNSDCYVDPDDPSNCDPDDPESNCYAPADENGERSGGSDKLSISIKDNPIERKRFCLGENEIVTGPYSSTNDVDRLELYFNGILVKVTEIFNVYGPVKNGEFFYEITSEMLSKYFTATGRGHNFEVYVYVYDVLGNKHRANMSSKFIDCAAEDATLQKLSITVEKINKKLCYCNDLRIVGYAKSTLEIKPENIRLEINNQLVDYRNLGAPKVNPCVPEIESDVGEEPTITPDPKAISPEDELLEMAAIFTVDRESRMDNREHILIKEEYTDYTYPVRVVGNHPLKSIQIRVNGKLVLDETYTFDEMVFDTIYSLRLEEATDEKEFDISISGEHFSGYEDNTRSYSFGVKELKTKLNVEKWQDPMTLITGDYGIYPSQFYNLVQANYVKPYYAMFETDEYVNDVSVMSINSFNAAAVKTTSGRVPFDITIPYWKMLELGCTPTGKYKLKLYVSDTSNEKSKSYTVNMSDCVGSPKDKDNDIEWTKEEVSCLVCKCEDLTVKGYMTSLDEIKSIQLYVNGKEVDPTNLGAPVTNPCTAATIKSTVENSKIEISSEVLNQSVVNFNIPYWKLLDLGCVPGKKYNVKIKGATAKDKTTSIYSFRMSENCTESTIESGDCSVCENGDCGAESDKITIKINELKNKPCDGEDLVIKGNIASTGGKLEEVELRINDVEINPYDLFAETFTAQYKLLPMDTTHNFEWTIPYWKLIELGCELKKSYPIRITAYAEDGEIKKTVKKTLYMKNCNAGPDEPSYDDECHETESVIIHYYDAKEEGIKEETIPLSLLPYQIDNGAGTIARICLRDTGSKGVSVEIIESGDESGYAFQLWAAGVNYYHFGDTNNIRTVWADSFYSKSNVTNPSLMLGEPTKANNWLANAQAGDFESAPSLNAKGSIIYFNMPKAYKKYKCKNNLECGKRVKPTPTGKTCNEITYFLVQYYSAQSKGLRMTKIPVSHKNSDKAEYKLDEKTVIKAIWKSDLDGIALQVVKAEHEKSVMITAIGLMYNDPDGYGHTEWAKTLRYSSEKAQNPQFVLNGTKKLSELTWINSGVVDISKASYIGAVGDSIVVKISEETTKKLCKVDKQPSIDIPEERLKPSISLNNEKLCEGSGLLNLEATITDYMGVTSFTYSIVVNDTVPYVYNIRHDIDSSKSQTISIPINTDNLYAGDTLTLTLAATNIGDVEVTKTEIRTIAYCDSNAPVINTFSIAPSMIHQEGKYCYGDLTENQMSVLINATDDRAIASYKITQDGKYLIGETYRTFMKDIENTITEVPIKLPDKVIGYESENHELVKADIVFIFDTSSSMNDEIDNVRYNLNVFKQSLLDKGIDAYFGYIDSNHKDSTVVKNLTPSESFNLNGVTTNTSTWESLKWEQFTSTTQGGLYFLNQFRPGATRIFIAVTDATITADLTENIISKMTDNSITVYFINKKTHATNTKYNTLMERTGGSRFNIDSEIFGIEMDNLSTNIITKTTSHYPDKDYTLILEVVDLAGNSSKKELTFTMTECVNEEEEPPVVEEPPTEEDPPVDVPREGASDDENAITNDYNILIRTKWGSTPSDVDTYLFRNYDNSTFFSFNYGKDDGYPEDVRAYQRVVNNLGETVGELFLNMDYTLHNSDSQYDTEYEIITINGFPNETFTIVMEARGTGVQLWSLPPQVEIVDAATDEVIYSLSLPASEWAGKRHLRVCDFYTDSNGKFKGIGRGPEFINSLSPTN